MSGTIVGVALWAVIFVPLATFGIQVRIDNLKELSPRQDVFLITSRFDGLYYTIIGGALAFHLTYGAFRGYLAGGMHELQYARDRRMIQ